MSCFSEIVRRTKVLTFDCYGTLIDWDAGLFGVFREVFGSEVNRRRRELFEAYVTIEAELESGSFRSYREVVTVALERLAARFEWVLPANRRGAIADTLPNWRPFADTGEALARLKKRFRLGVLSNIDRELFTGTARHFPVAFDFVITAQDVGAYKPSAAHLQRFLRDFGGLGSSIHVAQSLFHDGRPAGELGVAFVWINRYKEANGTTVRPLVEFADLRSFADAVDAVMGERHDRLEPDDRV